MIENSINWDKAVELVQEVVPRNHIEKIKNVQNQNTLNEYKSLVNFLLGKLTYSSQNKVSYLRFWEAPKTISSTSSSTIKNRPTTSSTTSTQEGIPDWIKLVGGIILFIILIRACN